MQAAWVNATGLTARKFRCGFCGSNVSSGVGWYSNGRLPYETNPGQIFLCPDCEKPNFYCGENRYPIPAPGNSVSSVPKDVYALYEEGRRCVGARSFTGSVLCSRKLLMNVAVSQGAKEGLTFIQYVEHLSSAGYVPPNGKGWVDHIRRRGNEATHEITPMTEADAVELISFCEMLLKFVYEFPAKVPSQTDPS